MTIDNQIKDEKLQYDINRGAPKISALSSCKIYQYEYLTGEEILTKLTYSPPDKAFQEQKQLKIKERNNSKQLKVIISMLILMKMNYCFQRKEKYLNNFTTKDLIEQKN